MSMTPQSGGTEAFRIGPWLCEPSLNRIRRNGRAVQLEPKVMQVLVRLAEQGGRVTTRRELLDTVWAGTTVGEQVLSRAVSELRKVFDDDSRTPRVIETIAKSGYRLIVPVERVEASSPTPTASGPDAKPRPRTPASATSPTLVGWTGLGLVALGLIGGALLSAWLRDASPTPITGPRLTASIRLPAEAPPEFSEMRCFELSPDGTRFVYTARVNGRRQLYSRRMDRDEVSPVQGTEDGFGPFFSPDGSWLGFYAGGKLRRVPAEGGTPVTLAEDASDAVGATWREDGTIVYVRRLLEGLHWMPAGQGPRALTTLNSERGERSHFWPRFLPDGKRLLFTVWHGGSIDSCDIELLDIDTGQRRTLIRGGADARYLAEGYLLFARSGTLMRMDFDATRGEVTGTPAIVHEDLLTHPFSGVGNFAVANNGILVEAPRESFADLRALYRMTESGDVRRLDSEFASYATPRLSPDGHRLATTGLDQRMQIWLHDIDRGTVERLTRDGQNFWPVWTPDGRRVAFTSDRAGTFNLFWMGARGDATAERLTVSDNIQFPGSWSPDGKRFAFSEFHPDTRWDIWMLPLDGNREPEPFLTSPFDEFRPTLSPDRTLMAYVSNEAGRWDEHGRWEVYVRPIDDPETRVRVSSEGGGDPAWSRDGKTLYYRQGNRLLAVSVASRQGLALGASRVVSNDLRLPEATDMLPAYDVAPDGSFLLMRLAEPARPTYLRLRQESL